MLNAGAISQEVFNKAKNKADDALTSLGAQILRLEPFEPFIAIKAQKIRQMPSKGATRIP